MSKADLLKLAEKASEYLINNAKTYRDESNKQPHMFLVDTNNIRNQILTQIRRKNKGVTDRQNEQLLDAISTYVHDLYNTFKFRKSKEYTYTIYGIPPSFKVLVTPINGGNAFEQIKAIRRDRRNEIKLTKVISDIFKRDKNVTEDSLAHLFDLGHVEGSSIAEQVINNTLSKFSSIDTTSFESKDLDRIVKVSIASKERAKNLEVGKQFIVTVEDESFSANQLKGSTIEKKYLEEVRTLLGRFISNHSGWADQKGSRGASDIAISELLKVMKKSTAKVKTTVDTRPSAPNKVTVKKTVKSTKKATSSQYLSDITVDIPDVEENNWSSIIAIINQKLESTLIQNMRAPSLVNRTGTFASSAKVTGVDITPDGYPSFIYDYKRDPYQVFDRTLGKAPWNTPERDPKTLITTSIRDIVKELAIGRFYTRRV